MNLKQRLSATGNALHSSYYERALSRGAVDKEICKNILPADVLHSPRPEESISFLIDGTVAFFSKQQAEVLSESFFRPGRLSLSSFLQGSTQGSHV